MTDDLIRAFQEGRKAERKAISNWLQDKAYLTLASLVRGNVHSLEAEEIDRQRSKVREQSNRAD
jgi:predicted AlkP superfamily phosphohydrolase/phosphomutase